jgi:mRNA-degrading endonuclease YafQ of YafQ-DinJ toxin-antitoxin module|tara:strand:+ start:342 stop:515 length:174 start_codon:yes stop_codon:yes gene_type:complete
MVVLKGEKSNMNEKAKKELKRLIKKHQSDRRKLYALVQRALKDEKSPLHESNNLSPI